ncbi:helix-turn-helix domain-containing protein [Pontibacter cellulosilyticus]|uniref:Helix-turn-helix transcriptional regulator n=1 Tax=Pontibacter cellulosilyticus TaxID=1720253 RepID=A0A923N6Q7_9BACT|nr:helix-turn-helix transcriptional regulator [Pontibacter cellulosilyticus]MBC5992757.1 helix-turn-helix transcriptional regulator [Pontibacter cellulosilyticus]
MKKATIAQNLLRHRKRKGLTQEQLSENYGVTVRTIQRIENAKVEPHFQTLSLLAQSLEVEVKELSCSEPADAPQSNTAVRKWLLLFHLLPLMGVLIPFANLMLPLIL